jgi:hypothetical protein
LSTDGCWQCTCHNIIWTQFFLLEGDLTFIPQPIIWDGNSKTNAGILAYYHMKICISLWLFDWTEFLRSFYYLYKKLWCYLIFFYVEGWHLNICRKASAFYFMTTKKNCVHIMLWHVHCQHPSCKSSYGNKQVCQHLFWNSHLKLWVEGWTSSLPPVKRGEPLITDQLHCRLIIIPIQY